LRPVKLKIDLVQQISWAIERIWVRQMKSGAEHRENAKQEEANGGTSEQDLNNLSLSNYKSMLKTEFMRGPGRGDTCHLSVFDETLKTSSVTPICYYRIVISMTRCNFLQSLKKF